MRLPLHYELNEIQHLGKVHQPKGITVVFGGQAGSEGKGAIGGWLARRYDWAIAAATFMPNAGHTYVDEHGADVVVTQLPVGMISPRVDTLAMGASSVINLEQCMTEIDRYDQQFDVQRRLVIHPRAQVMLPEYVDWEGEHLQYIASTAKGCGAALAAKVRREQSVVMAKDHPTLKEWVKDDFDLWINGVVDKGGAVLAEQSQGFDLDIHHGTEYPYCTSRQCTPSQMCADLGLEARLITNSIAVVRTFPIKVGNARGHSGEYSSPETDWGSVSQSAGRRVEERTTVTDRVRRVFEFDYDRINEMSQICRPTQIALTFADYIDPSIFGMTQEVYANEHYHTMIRASRHVFDFLYHLERAVARPTFNPAVRILKTGPQDDHTLNLGLSL